VGVQSRETRRSVSLPTDSHVHSEWSWDAQDGSMERSCARAMALGLPAIAFTEHLDHTVFSVALDDQEDLDRSHPLVTSSDPQGWVSPPALDVAGYLESIDRCRDLFPDLRVFSGLELGEPHWHAQAANAVLAAGTFDRVIGSLHCLPDGDRFCEPPGLYRRRRPADVVRSYLEQVAILVTRSDAFSVLGHIDYPLRTWPRGHGPVDLYAFEAEFRHALRTTAQSNRALEISTLIPLHATLLRWWHEEGGDAVTFGSDAHAPSNVGRHFEAAAGMAEAAGFRPGNDPFGPWARTS